MNATGRFGRRSFRETGKPRSAGPSITKDGRKPSMPPFSSAIRHLLAWSADTVHIIQFKRLISSLSSEAGQYHPVGQLLYHCGVLRYGSINRMLRSHWLERLISGHRGPALDGEQGIRHEDDDYY